MDTRFPGLPGHPLAAGSSIYLREALDRRSQRLHAERRKRWIRQGLLAIIAALLFFAGFAIATAAHAAPAPQAPPRFTLDANLTSYHTEAWARKHLNQDNPGLGLEYRLDQNWSLAWGFYCNSYRRTSTYALAEWTPLHGALPFGLEADAGLAGGMISGYRRSEVPTAPLAAGLVLRIRDASGWGINLLGVPNTTSGSGFVGLQLAMPIA